MMIVMNFRFYDYKDVYMKKLLSLIVLATILVCSVHAQSTKKKYPKPINYEYKVLTRVLDKTRNYYALHATEGAEVLITGPGTLRVISRGKFTVNDRDKIKYGIRYTVDGGEIMEEKFLRVPRSKKAYYLEEGPDGVAAMREFEISLGRGDHSLSFLLGEKTDFASVRFIFYPAKAKKQKWMSYSPVNTDMPIVLVSNETMTKYYRFSSDKPMNVKAKGPAELRVMTRVENHYDMKGRINYRIQVTENGEVLNTYHLSSRRSEVTTYLEDESLVPGKACEFVINVPSGTHTYEIAPLDKVMETVLGRILIPEKDIKLK